MKRPNIEDYHQDKTGENLMNPPYNLNRYRSDLEKYIDFLESNQKEFEEWLEYNAIFDKTLEKTLTKYKELNKTKIVESKDELDCPYNFTSRCTMGRCDCKPKN